MKPRAWSARESVRGIAGEGGLQERPGDPGRALGVAQVGDRPLGEVGLDREVGAVVDLVVADQRLREHDPDRALHPRRGAVHRVPAPGRGAVEVERVVAVAADPDLERRVHDEVAPRPRRAAATLSAKVMS